MNVEPSATLLEEYRTLATAAGAVDVSDRTKIELRGDDRAAFLNNFCTNDIKRLERGQGCEAFFCNVKGHVVGHGDVYCEEHSLWIDTVPGQSEKLIAHLDRYLIREKVEIIDRTADFAEFVVVGPLTGESLMQITDLLPTIGAHAAFQWQKSVTVRRFDLGSVPAFRVLMDRSHGEVSRVFDLPLCSPDALEMLRIEAGVPHFGVDITEANLPQEIDRNEKAISFTKGCYLGQETVARIDALGHVNRTLCGVRFKGSEIPAAGMVLKQGEKAVGEVTSGCWSVRCGGPLALAYVRRGANLAGSLLDSPLGEAAITHLPLTA
jgi:tRNA-modifying protein YgfZ